MVFWVGQSESRPQQVMGRGTWIASTRFGAEREHETGDAEFPREDPVLEQCAIEYRDQEGFALERRVETGNACFFSSLNLATEFGAGTFAPSIVGPETETTSALSTSDGTMYVPEVIGPVEIGMEEVP